MERRPLMRPRAIALLSAMVIVVVASVAAVATWGRRGDASNAPAAVQASATTDTAARAPANTRIRIRVLNASTRAGLARRGALYLRALGYDVVDWGTDPVARDRTQVDDHGHAEWAARVARALGGATITTTPESLRQLDLTVRLGRDWRAPADFFRP